MNSAIPCEEDDGRLLLESRCPADGPVRHAITIIRKQRKTPILFVYSAAKIPLRTFDN